MRSDEYSERDVQLFKVECYEAEKTSGVEPRRQS